MLLQKLVVHPRLDLAALRLAGRSAWGLEPLSVGNIELAELVLGQHRSLV